MFHQVNYILLLYTICSLMLVFKVYWNSVLLINSILICTIAVQKILVGYGITVRLAATGYT